MITFFLVVLCIWLISIPIQAHFRQKRLEEGKKFAKMVSKLSDDEVEDIVKKFSSN